MPRPRKRLTARERDLDDWLAGADAMLLGELDGYLTGILVCPELLLPSDWLSVVWARHPDSEADAASAVASALEAAGDDPPADDDFAFESEEEAQEVIGLIMARYNAIATDLQRGRFAPLFDRDQAGGEALWEVWIEGFQQALALRPEAWDAALEAGEEVRVALGGLFTLASVADDDSDLKADDINALTDAAPELIVTCVEALHAWRLSQRPDAAAPGAARGAAKVGRNDPCPCGSGRKFKKCCGAG
jgi:uncharacterized protein